ncbi:MAG: DNA polymerase III subunit alpha [Planctomycetes bacterium]|nr:DNA polymerase III subunit alpha [Planctomycetota bacterium]
MDNDPQFVHLHLHTEFSLLDGGNRIGQLAEYVKEQGMDTVAVTDHGNLFGAIAFYTAAKAAGIKPILGIEAYVAVGDRTERTQTGVADGGFHLVLLARNMTGWQNLLKLSSDSYANGFYYKPRMDRTTLSQWSEGLIAINGHLGSSLAHHLTSFAQTGDDRSYQAARAEALWHAQTFGPDENGEPSFYIEVQRHSVELQNRINPYLVQLARELSIPIVCDNDSHFMRPEDHDTHDTLICISMGKTKDDTARLTYPQELYVKSPAEMAELFADLPEALESTVRIANRCNVDLDFSSNYAPVVKPIIPPEDVPYTGGDRTKWYKAFCAQYELEPFDSTRDVDLDPEALHVACDTALSRLAEAGLVWRYGRDGITKDIRDRLQRELGILSEKGIAAYFLIVWDFVNWARQNGIPANARGSGVGTMVGYVLGLSNACPVQYGLLFERFTDPDRSEYPDIDIDICQDGRPKVIDYVRQKYGHVAQIITFGTLKARAAIKDVGRVMGMLPGETQRLANLIPDQLNITIDESLEAEPDLMEEYRTKPEVTQLLDTARRLEGQVRHAGVHAAGVVVATQPLDSIVPLSRPPGAGADSSDLVTQWDGPTVERVGLLKMDFLGLRTLSTLERCKQLVRESLSEEAIRTALGIDDPERDPLDLDMLGYTDPRVFELFQRGDTAGVFQFESGGMRRLLVEMQPDRLEDLIAANALYRPGPMDLIPDYNRRKHGQEPVPKVHPIVDRYTAETYGVMVYQEQVMQICHELGGDPAAPGIHADQSHLEEERGDHQRAAAGVY